MSAGFTSSLPICLGYELLRQPRLDGLYRYFQAVFALILVALIYLILLFGKYVRWLLKLVACAADSPLLIVVELIPGVRLVLDASVHRISRQVGLSFAASPHPN